jgi:hypothetical protein
MGRWSASHRKIAIWGWLGFVPARWLEWLPRVGSEHGAPPSDEETGAGPEPKPKPQPIPA